MVSLVAAMAEMCRAQDMELPAEVKALLKALAPKPVTTRLHTATSCLQKAQRRITGSRDRLARHKLEWNKYHAELTEYHEQQLASYTEVVAHVQEELKDALEQQALAQAAIAELGLAAQIPLLETPDPVGGVTEEKEEDEDMEHEVQVPSPPLSWQQNLVAATAAAVMLPSSPPQVAAWPAIADCELPTQDYFQQEQVPGPAASCTARSGPPMQAFGPSRANKARLARSTSPYMEGDELQQTTSSFLCEGGHFREPPDMENL
jgi:hypothetical protein